METVAISGDPYELSGSWPEYATLTEHSPVHRVTLANGHQLWLVSGYEAVQAVESDPRFRMSLANALPELADRLREGIPAWARPLSESLMTSDPPQHTRLRRLVQPAFSPGLLASMRPRIQRIVDDLLDRLQATGTLEIVGEFAFPMTTAVVSEFLGFPFADRELISSWTQVLVTSFTKQDPSEVERVANDFTEYLRSLFVHKRRQPGEDVISALIRASDEDGKLTPEELTAMVFVIVGGGFETTIILLSHGTKALVEQPDQLRLLARRPELSRTAVEELLRYGAGGTSPVRYAAQDVDLMGTVISRGATVMPLYSSANFDPRRFPDPHRLDITREHSQHFSFGHGPHYCLGAPLARLEADVAFGTLARRLPGLCLDDAFRPNPTWQEAVPFVRKIARMELLFDTGPR